MFTLLDLCVSSLRRGHANLLCIVPMLTDDPRRESENYKFATSELAARTSRSANGVGMITYTHAHEIMGEETAKPRIFAMCRAKCACSQDSSVGRASD